MQELPLLLKTITIYTVFRTLLKNVCSRPGFDERKIGNERKVHTRNHKIRKNAR
jgi:hypothetical protein